MSDLVIEPIDSVFIKVDCERSFAKELSDHFTFQVPGHKFMPAYRNKMWDGQIKLYNIYKQQIYAGLSEYVEQFAKDRSYSFTNNIPNREDSISIDGVIDYIKTLNPHAYGKSLVAHDHQIDAIHHALNHKRCLLLSPTGSGKSLIIYVICRYLLSILPKDRKILIIVPTISLVSQMYSDFFEYASKTNWKTRDFVHKIFGGEEKNSDKRIIVSTWQSIYKMPQKYFDQFGTVMGDECHLFKSKSLTTIMTKLTDCDYRIGTTGTLDGSFTHKLVIEGLFGRVKHVTTTKKLMEKDILSGLEIDCLVLNHPNSVRQELKRATYQEELDWLVANPARNQFISNLAMNLKGNTLVLFQYVEKHGKILHQLMNTMNANKTKDIFFIYGGTDVEMRESVRKLCEKQDNAIIIASYGTFSTGVSIKRLHNIVFSSPSKSRIRVLQSIGRQLRKSEFKDKARLFDIADDLQWKSYQNHTLRHFIERLKIYESENFSHRKINIKLESICKTTDIG